MNAGAVEAVDRIVNRGGDPAEVVRAVVGVLHERLGAFVALGGEEAGARPAEVERFPVAAGAVLEVGAPLDAAARATAERVAVLVSPYVPR